jgi:lipoprotein NlpI
MRQSLQRSFGGLAPSCLGIALLAAVSRAQEPPAASDPVANRTQLEEQRVVLNKQIEQHPDDVELYSQRGDVHFFLGEFDDAVADYDRMVELQPELDASHWRRGIAYFYAGQYEQAAGQFERYHTFDNVDRENGIWRFLSQVKAYGLEEAREGLLKYDKDDREPFPDVYRLFAGAITPGEILQHIAEASISESERDKRLFYAELYIGLNYAVEDKPDEARPHLQAAARNQWGESAGYGPHYMWRVAGLHRDLLAQQPVEP